MEPFRHDDDSDDDEPPVLRRWFHYVPLCVAIVFVLMPHPSLILVLTEYYLKATFSPFKFSLFLFVPLLITFLSFCSLIVCVARDPGRPAQSENEALMNAIPEEPFHPKNWCRKCDAPKPERTHHCSFCSRCVLKMDHHCPWLAHKCVGFRTYPAFLHFLTCLTLLSVYCTCLAVGLLWLFIYNPYSINEYITFHALFLALAGAVFTLVVGSFLSYHIYLLTTNQTSLEHLAQYLLLRYLPSTLPSMESFQFSAFPRPSSPDSLTSDISLSETTHRQNTHSLAPEIYYSPVEHELNYKQRRMVRAAHAKIRPYDIGWKRNWAQVLGWRAHSLDWITRLWYGGGCLSDGYIFPRNPGADVQLDKLALELYQARS